MIAEGGKKEGRKWEKELKKERVSGEVLSARVSFLRPAIACVCAQCVSSVVKRQSVEHCSLLCATFDLYGGADTAAVVYRDNQIVSLSEESEVTAGNDREDGCEGGGVRDREGEAGSITDIVIGLSGILLRAIDGDVISGRDPLLMEGVVSSVLLLLQTEGVSVKAVSSTLHKMVQVCKSLPALLNKNFVFLLFVVLRLTQVYCCCF